MAGQFADKLYIWDMAIQFTYQTIYMGYRKTIYRSNDIYGIWPNNLQISYIYGKWPDNLQIKRYIRDMAGQFTDKTIYMGYGRTV